MSYHNIEIHKHHHKSPWKLVEESTEFIDALASKNRIMAGVELADLYGALIYQASLLGLTTSDLEIMHKATVKAFTTSRPSFNLYEYLREHAEVIREFGLGFIQVKVGNINYHFYSDEVAKFDNADQPHNHQYAFISEIIKGEIEEKMYSIVEGDDILFCVCGDHSKTLDNVGYQYRETLHHKAGEMYYRNHHDWHTVTATNGTITKVTKMTGSDNDAFAFGETTKYESKHTEEELWTIIQKITP